MKKTVVLIIFVLLFVAILSAQAKEYSYKKAIAASLLFPGGGELYIKKYKTAGILIASELAVLFSYQRMKSQEKWEEENYKQYAYIKAGIPKNSDKVKYFLASKWFSSEDYNNYVKLNAYNFYSDDPENYQAFLDENIIPEEEGWNWHSREFWMNYKKSREDTQNYKIYANLIASGFVLNRIFSILDSMISIKKLNNLKLSASCDLKKKGIRIKYAYRFF